MIGPLGGFSVSIAATGLIYLSYLLTNLGVLAARFRGWPHKPAWFNLGRWGKLVNILAIVYGGLMLLNIAIWQDPNLFGNFGGAGRAFTNPTIDTFIKPFGNTIAGMPAWPIFETLVGVLARRRRRLLRRLGPRPGRRRRVGRRRDRRGHDRVIG